MPKAKAVVAVKRRAAFALDHGTGTRGRFSKSFYAVLLTIKPLRSPAYACQATWTSATRAMGEP